jgi:signal transduction histidine kinase
MGLHSATGFNRRVTNAEATVHHVGRFNIGPRLILGFAFIFLAMLAADAVILWQFHVVRTQAGRLNDIDRKLVAVLRVHSSLLTFYDRLDARADSEDADRLVTEAGSLRAAVQEHIRRATSTLSLLPADLQQDPTILPTLQVIQSALASQVEGITTLATSGDWRAVHLRVANQVRPLESLASALVETVAHEAGEQQAQIVLNIGRMQRLVFLVVPLTAVVTLLIAATLGLAITRSITHPLARLVEGSQALARGDFQHQVSVRGNDELARLGHVFNDTARRLRDLYATLQSSEAYLAEAQRLSRTGSFGWNIATGGIFWSEETFRIFKYDRTTTPTVERVLQRTHPQDAAFVKETIERASQDGTDLDFEHRLLMPDGSVTHVHVVGHADKDESGELEYVGAVMDVTERRRAEAELEDLAGRLIHAQEEERRRVGRELHDHISQMLGVLTIKIDQLQTSGEIAPDIGGALDDLRRETGNITDEVRRLSHRLHSSTLDYLGLVPALQKLVSEFSERHDIAITFAHASVPSLPSEVALCLFRIAEEGLANIARHSRARSARVHIAGTEGGIHLRLEDAGTGFDMTAPERKAGLGLISMQERLRLLHGTMHVDSAPSRGTRIDAWVPPRILAAAHDEAAHRSETA